ncbi:PAS domain-containing protein [Gloeothece verrucosa]|uniref:Circadian input-output histidine kinase CikA n=1 Tax=Gloeothece verrucosa (strain PCC 7822) TaxID=497965 RepID=E0UIX4_GLOV7|nr:PAS domain-containing protein [Gloeothece verrucosa]ADN14554.1 PAS/PAC sensor hybrid histidine kinase [Gloeothece verrucosa PCC 7822]
MTQQTKATISENIFAEGGEMGKLMRSLDWSQTLLGPVSEWPQSLKTSVSIILNSRYPMFVWWGPQYANLYNDAYRPLLGASKHPQYLGKSAKDCWAEVWDVVGPLADSVLVTGQPAGSEDLLLIMDRNGYDEETYFTFSYSPIRDESGEVGGVFCAVIETTERIIGERRLRTLRELGDNRAQAQTVQQACQMATKTLSSNQYDIPFALLYLIDAEGKSAYLAGTTTNLEAGTLISPLDVDLQNERDPWHLTEVHRTKTLLHISDLTERWGALPGGNWPEQAHSALVMPLAQLGWLIVGISPRRELDDHYRGFFDLVSHHLSYALANAEAYETDMISLPTGLAHLPKDKVSHQGGLTFNKNNGNCFGEEALGGLPEDKPTETVPDRAAIATVFGSRPRILLADDNADMRDYIKRLLTDLYEVETVSDGIAVLEALARELPDLVLTDVMMPGLDGFELLRELRANPNTRQIPIILLSARAGEPSRVEGLKAGADDYLIKPFSARELLARVETHLKMAQIREENAHREQQLRIEAEEARKEVINILETITDGFFSLDHQWRFTYVNQETERLCQKTREEFLGHSIWEVYPELINSEFDQQLRRAASQKISVHFESPSLYARLWREVHIYPHQNGLAVYWRDITQRKQIEAALSQSETQFRQLADAMPQIVWITNAAGKVEYLNQQWFDYTALPQNENSYNPEQIRSAIHPDDLSTIVESWKTAFTNQTPYQSEFRLRRGRDGSYRWFLGRAVVIKGPQGEIIAWYGTSTDIDDYKQAELCIRKKESLLNALIASSPIGISFFDQDLCYLYVNQALATINGVPLNEHLGRSLEEVLPLMAAEFRPLLTQILQTQQPLLNHEFMGEIIPGNFRHCLANHFPVCLPDGEVLGIGVTVMDITQLKQVEAALRASEATATERAQELETLMEITPVGLWIAHDPDCHSMSANQTAYQLMQAKPGDIATATPPDGTYPLNFKQRRNGKEITPDDLPMQVAARSGQEITDEIEFVFEDGTVRFIYGRAIPLTNESGQIRGVIGAFVDITERKQAEEALRQSEQRYRYLAEAIPQLVWITNSQGYNEYVNQQMCEYTGLTFEQLLQFDWREIIHPEDIEQTYQKWMAAVEQDGYYEMEYRLRNAQGKYQWYLGRAIPLKNEQGKIVKWFGTSTNIDAQKQLEAQRESLLSLERAAREQAEEANRIKDEFLAVLSHELRSPLNPILGWAKLLQTQNFNAETYQKGLSTIERNAALQAQLIEDLLDISRIMRGKLNLKIVPVNLIFIIESALETVRLAAEAKTINIQKDLDLTVGKVLGDTARLQQIVWNLLSNAVKFTPTGGQVNVKLEGSGNEAVITVSDTGQGISANFLPYVFDYFRQADSKTTRKFGGLGLGLAIVRHLVELHGGTVTANSPGENQGATFSVKLPLINQDTIPKTDSTDITESHQQRSILQLSGMDILVVDDDADTRDFLGFLLREAGAKVVTLASATEALQVLAGSKPDVLLCDIGMPEIDGYMLIKQVRIWENQSGEKPILAIALTAYAGDLNHEKALKAGFQHHISKPIKPEELLKFLASKRQ